MKALAASRRLVKVLIREVPGLLLLLVLTALWTLIREDIAFDDEAGYLSTGLGTSEPDSFSAGPVYGQVYRIVALVTTDPVSTYLMGRALVACTFVLGVWLATRLIARPIIAWTIAAVAAAIPVSHVWTGVATPAAALMTVAVAMLWRWQHAWSLAVVSALTWIAAGMRPELVLMAMAVTIWSLVATVRQVTHHRPVSSGAVARASVLGGVALIVPVVLILRFGHPWSGGSRSWAAFSQHYALRTFLPGENPWYDHVQITTRSFGSAENLLDALVANPSAMWAHVSQNALAIPWATLKFLWGTGPQLVSPETISQILVLLTACAVAWSIGCLLVRRAAEASDPRTTARHPWAATGSYLTMWLLTMAVSLAAISPRQHYLVGVVSLMLLGAGALINTYAGRVVGRQVLPSAFVILVTGLAALTLAATVNTLIPTKPYAAEARRLEGLPKPVKFLAGLWGLQVYVPGIDLVDPAATENSASFQDFLDQTDTQVIFVNPTLAEGSWATLPGFEEFVDDPSSFGFVQSSGNSQLWLREDLAGRAPTQ